MALCRTKNKSAFCQEKHLYEIPYGIPDDTTKLFLQDNQIKNSKELEDTLSRLVSLQLINFCNNNLTAVPMNLPRTLTRLMLVSNQVKYVGWKPLSGLVRLQHLQLDSNQLTDNSFASSTFHDTKSLHDLLLVDNKLKSIPEGLPPSLKLLKLSKNLINTISITSLEKLSNLERLFLDDNRIVSLGIEYGAFGHLSALNTLELRSNQLTEIPPKVPSNLQNLHLSFNNISYIYKTDSFSHGGLASLPNLQTLDISYNQLQSVAPDSFIQLREAIALQLHDNPWRCDCYLGYLKKWLKQASVPLSHEELMTCSTPRDLDGVALNNIELQALKCPTRESISSHLTILSTHRDKIKLRWSCDVIKTGFVTRRLMYGRARCGNCSNFDENVNHAIQNLISDVNFEELPSDHINVTIARLQPATSYAICVLDSLQLSESIPIHQCLLARTQPEYDVTNAIGNDVSLSTTWVVVIAILSSGLVVVGIALIYYRLKGNPPKQRHKGRFYVPTTIDNTRDFCTRRQAASLPPHLYERTYETNYSDATRLSDRTYAECGSYHSSQHPHPHPDPAVDARKEFQSFILHPRAPKTSRHMVSPFQESLTSSDGPDTMSTYQTGTIGSRDTVDDLIPSTSTAMTSPTPAAPYDHLMPHHTAAMTSLNLGSRREYGNLFPSNLTNSREMYI